MKQKYCKGTKSCAVAARLGKNSAFISGRWVEYLLLSAPIGGTILREREPPYVQPRRTGPESILPRKVIQGKDALDVLKAEISRCPHEFPPLRELVNLSEDKVQGVQTIRSPEDIPGGEPTQPFLIPAELCFPQAKIPKGYEIGLSVTRSAFSEWAANGAGDPIRVYDYNPMTGP